MGYGTINACNTEVGITTISLNRQDTGNAYNGQMIEELLAEFSRISEDPTIRVVIIRGEGKNFQCGADINWLEKVRCSGKSENESVSLKTCQMMRELNSLRKPTIATVQGLCAGGGTGLVAACDVVIAEETASFSISEARWGVSASIIFPMLNAAIGVRNVRRYALTTERFDANQARFIGLVHEVVGSGDLEAYSNILAKEILKSAPRATEITKTGILHSSWSATSDIFDSLMLDHASIRQSEEAKEGFRSFFEKRDAVWDKIHF
ncbi:MAG: enoyl-CoA hydratase-related protein [Pseudomonadota bacterium]|nr:enoyl-CoA hydratase-related protein [Pseudomonadota bacterium]